MEMTDMTQANFEVLLDGLGHFGYYQILIYILVTLLDLLTGMIMTFFIFATATPPWTCRKYHGMTSPFDSNDTVTSGAEPLLNMSSSSSCTRNESRCEAMVFERRYETIVTEWLLVCEESYIPKLTTSLLMLGVLLGAFTAGHLSDKYGRKKVIIGAAFMLMFAQTMVGFSINWQMFTALRFIVGIFLGAVIGICVVIPMEFIGPRWRSFCGAVGIFDLGHALMVLVAYLLPNWRHQAFASGTILIPIVVANLVLVPESIRWLIQKGRFSEAHAVVRRMAKVNKKPAPDLCFLRKIANADSETKEKDPHYGYMDLMFGSRKLAKTTLAVAFCWFTVSSVYYGLLVSISSLSGDIYVNNIISIALAMPLTWTIFPVANCVGRKRCYIIYCSLPVLSMFAIVVLNATGYIKENGILVNVFGLIGRAGISATWTLTSFYTAEVYPTLMRSIGIGIGNTAARIGGIVAPQFVYLGVIGHWTIPYIINGSLALISSVLVFALLPETNKRPLTEDMPPERKCLDYLTCKGKTDTSRNSTGYNATEDDGDTESIAV